MKTSVYIATTLDGFIARKDGALDWLPGADGAGDVELRQVASKGFASGLVQSEYTVLSRRAPA